MPHGENIDNLFLLPGAEALIPLNPIKAPGFALATQLVNPDA